MKKILTAYKKHLYLLLLIGTILTILGLLQWPLSRSLPAEFTLSTFYEGASAEEIETLVTSPLETAIQSIEGIKAISSVSYADYSHITVMINPPINQDNLNSILTTLKKMSKLPEHCSAPVITAPTSLKDSIISLTLSGAESKQLLRSEARHLKQKLEQLKGIQQVKTKGLLDPEIHIYVNPDLLHYYQISLDDIKHAVQDNHHAISAGRIYKESGVQQIRTGSSLSSIDDIYAILVPTNKQFPYVSMRQLAWVEPATKHQPVLYRTNGLETIHLSIIKEPGARKTDVIQKVRQSVESARNDLQLKSITIRYDEVPLSSLTPETLKVVAWIGIIIVLIMGSLFILPNTLKLSKLSFIITYRPPILMILFLSTSLLLVTLFSEVDHVQNQTPSFTIYLEAPSTVSLEQNAIALRKIETHIADLSHSKLRYFTSTIGQQDLDGTLIKKGRQYAQITVFLENTVQETTQISQIIDRLRHTIQNQTSFYEKVTYNTNSRPKIDTNSIQIRLLGNTYEDLETASQTLIDLLNDNKSLGTIRTNFKPPVNDFQINKVDSLVATYKVSPATINQHIHTAFNGSIVTTIQGKNEAINVRLLLHPYYRKNVNYLRDLLIPNTRGTLIQLKYLANFNELSNYPIRPHYQSKRSITLRATPPIFEPALRDIRRALKEMSSQYPDLQIEIEVLNEI